MATSTFRRRPSSLLTAAALAACVLAVWFPGLSRGLAFAEQHRTAWADCRVHGTPDPPPPLKTSRVYPHIAFQLPTELAIAPGSSRIFVTEQFGRVFSFPDNPETRTADLLIDAKQLVAALSQRRGEQLVLEGVYGLAFHPDFERNSFCYLCYAARHKDAVLGQHPQGSRVVRLTVSQDDPPRCDPASEVEILTWLGGGHNAGCLKFGPDGMLYVSTGDGGQHAPADGHQTGQDVSDLLCSILRIDVDRTENGRAYAIPADNPLRNIAGARPEIYAYGVRNPWKMSFDRLTGELWVGDVGLEMWEWVYRVKPGDNYGWSVTDGSHPFHTDWPRGPTPIKPPWLELSHAEAASLTGGFVYRGTKLPDYVGTYIFGDWETRRIWGVSADAGGPGPVRNLVEPRLRIIAFGEKHDGELLIADYDDGTLHELLPNDASVSARAFPMRLSETGLFADTAAQRPADGVLPFAINAEAWADHATAQRWIGIEGDGKIRKYATPELLPGTNFQRILHFPGGTVLAKTISVEMIRGRPGTARRLETQLLHYDGITWRGYTYAWNDAQTDAELVPAQGGRTELVIEDAAAPGGERRQTWQFPSRADCVRCHNPWAEHALAFSVPQIDRDVDVGGRRENQLALFERIGIIENQQATSRKAATDPTPSRLVATDDASASLADRARAYLHVNCGHCHRFGGGGSGSLRLNHNVSLDEAALVNAFPTQGGFGLDDARIIAAGDPFRSTLFYRIATNGPGRMPHIGSEIVDADGLALVHDWIASLPVESGPPDAAAPSALANLYSTTAALRLAWAMSQRGVAGQEDHALLAAAAAHPDATIAGLFERFVPAAQRMRRLGTAIDPSVILAIDGDPIRGRDFFAHADAVQCRTCHIVAGEGRAVGPALDGVGGRLDTMKLIESLLEPSKVIDPKYQAWLVQTVDGRAFSGLLDSRSASEVVIRDAEGKSVTIPAADIDALEPQRTSLMPEHLLRDLTAQQAADLVAYLRSLR